MKKNVLFDARAVREPEKFGKDVQLSFQSYRAYRGLYAYMHKDAIIILHFFNKKSQKTPLKNSAVARQRLKMYV